MKKDTPITKTSEEKEVAPEILEVNSWDISFNKKEFKLELVKSEDKNRIILKLINYKEFPPNYYILFFNKDDFYKLNYSFQVFASIDEIYSFLLKTINKKQYKLKQEDKAFNIIFNFMIFEGKQLNVSFILKESKNNYYFEIVYLLMHELSEECKSIKEQSITQNKICENNIKKFKKEIINIIRELKNEINKKDKDIKNIKKELENEIKKKEQAIINTKNELENEIDKKDKEIKSIINELKNENNKKDQVIINIKNELENKIDKKDKEIKSIINELKNEINKKDQEIKNIKNDLSKKDKEIINIKNELKNEINKKDQEIKNIKNELSKKDKEIINIKNELKNEINKNNQEIINFKNVEKNDIFNVSKIIKLEEEKNKLISWISEKGKIKELKLLYSSKKDGDNYSSFYNKCKNISPTLSLIKTKKGRRFGGFTFGKWNDEKGFLTQTDSEAFLFSLDNMKNYKILKPNFAIFSATDHSSFLGYGCSGDGKAYGIFLRDNYLTKGGGENHTSKVYNIDSQNCLSTEKDFYVEEVEVYNIIFN